MAVPDNVLGMVAHVVSEILPGHAIRGEKGRIATRRGGRGGQPIPGTAVYQHVKMRTRRDCEFFFFLSSQVTSRFQK